jgi:hypothetical protein
MSLIVGEVVGRNVLFMNVLLFFWEMVEISDIYSISLNLLFLSCNPFIV